ncbi:MAG: hypothetical protein UV82_C0002G0069 [Candidatus Magasanikbacteria bacterium GW2011_GWD2_43_18]|nr:MAG: hypothetical protein UV18_C0003G0069 [Candidatus Magasanikbacteria bacterium GW2011_GWC2_42_27]KKT05099.1 MAG: hypothetical protein UV82_C0002G0069 [Candidatus Magasanikbacteria bacterium GW2011_GWD2_43_18]KKT24332.1 MAG: hypothetical protein UW10_C0029G0011 [Candidatus Magasanikbacteria bacterium GW2011_GWA2_43_9]HBB38095.1 hypothetical protein [Candidatus Magasanikbacteria bacterium]HCC14083.1 hypothetical protein [Candidatus Magasanikbacteria bacterium]
MEMGSAGRSTEKFSAQSTDEFHNVTSCAVHPAPLELSGKQRELATTRVGGVALSAQTSGGVALTQLCDELVAVEQLRLLRRGGLDDLLSCGVNDDCRLLVRYGHETLPFSLGETLRPSSQSSTADV